MDNDPITIDTRVEYSNWQHAVSALLVMAFILALIAGAALYRVNRLNDAFDRMNAACVERSITHAQH